MIPISVPRKKPGGQQEGEHEVVQGELHKRKVLRVIVSGAQNSEQD